MNSVKWGVIGVAAHTIKRMYVPGRDSDSVEFWAVGSRSIERARSAAAMMGFTKAYGSYQEVLDDREVEAVFIPLPNTMHLEWIRKAADRGKHILCEKPLCMSREDTVAAIEYANSKGVLLMEAFMYRLHPQWKRARDLIMTQAIGKPQIIQTIFSFNNADAENIRNQIAMGGGAMADIGCYAISSARFLLGQEPKRAHGYVERQPNGVDLITSGLLDFDDARAQFTVSIRTFPAQSVRVFGSDGMLEVLLPFNAHADVPMRLLVRNGVGERVIEIPVADQYGIEWEMFNAAIRDGAPLPIPASDAINNQAAMDATLASARDGKWFDVEEPAV